jgi:hypothetical protein
VNPSTSVLASGWRRLCENQGARLSALECLEVGCIPDQHATEKVVYHEILIILPRRWCEAEVYDERPDRMKTSSGHLILLHVSVQQLGDVVRQVRSLNGRAPGVNMRYGRVLLLLPHSIEILGIHQFLKSSSQTSFRGMMNHALLFHSYPCKHIVITLKYIDCYAGTASCVSIEVGDSLQYGCRSNRF